MLSGNAFRHQIVLPQQQAIYDYWRSKCRGGKLPSRHDILPEDIKSQLPMISLIEPINLGLEVHYKYRLAGTGFYDLYEDEIQGRFISDLPIGDRCDYWHRVLSDVIAKKRPTAGVTRPGTPSRSHMAQFWIRLPLSDNGSDINLILGFDHMVKLSDVPNVTPKPEKISA